MDFEVFAAPSGVHSAPGYSHAIRVGNLVYCAGQVSRNQQGEVIAKGDIRRQTEQVYANLKTVLEAAGSGLDLIAKITVYTISRDYRATIGEVRDRVFAGVGHLPASTFLVVSSLADPDFMVEIEAVAMVRQPA